MPGGIAGDTNADALSAGAADGAESNPAVSVVGGFPYDADTAHDRRVRARLRELAAEAGLEPDALLVLLNAHAAAGEVPNSCERSPRSPGIAAGSFPTASVVAVRPADDVWGVTTVAHAGVPSAPVRPCGGVEPCPWRRDAPPGQFPAAAFELSAPTSAPGSTRRFGCHSSTPARPLVCAGWLLRGADGNPQIREPLRTGRLVPPEIPDGVELYDSYTEMAIANGVAPDHPALRALRRTQTAGAADDLVPLREITDETTESTARPMH
ncbi:DUF6283 family protein [Embleya sp. MST-111070]|uniref:DUF6283 family protein n=1 Tax=Embleya sp. MST-111070 TaxID=3398231 RepID=UPI003F732979